MTERSGTFTVEYTGRVAIVTICNEKKLNALNLSGYYELSQILREIAKHDEVFITFLTAKGRFFSAGADVSISRATPEDGPSNDVYQQWLRSFVANNLNTTQAFYTHPKVLVVGLNGPVVGLSAALVAFADFVYCTPSTFLLTPFSSLGLRLGISKANEALIMSRRIPSDELLQTGFVNKVFDIDVKKDGGDAKFRAAVLQEIDDRLGEHLVGDSLTGIKALIRKPETEVLDKQNVAEVFAGLDRFITGIPQAEFAKLASGAKRHKL
ncbi:delta3-cis-delta2-trans-enoyl isomerase [Apiospora aurea]|uniref:Delta3-cis-delta2-trans-enoyl isomerase n=1 Tax=Apiospora aurea TaxID=335848 RepID=A0ABR1PX01_9PEZI